MREPMDTRAQSDDGCLRGQDSAQERLELAFDEMQEDRAVQAPAHMLSKSFRLCYM
jgi:hypothetical protein